MKVKKFQAGTMPEVMKKVRDDLGADAVILNSKVIKTGGFLGMFKKNQTEVIAAIDPPEPKMVKREKKEDELPDLVPEKESGVQDNREIMRELQQLKSMLNSQKPDYPPLFQEAYQHMRDQEVEDAISRLVIENVREKYQENEDRNAIGRLLVKELYEQLKSSPFGRPTFRKPFVHLVGPTGVGKTTTLAKLAADAALNHNLRVGFITTDTYRIAAIDQLKTYAKILDIPLEVAYSSEDYREAKEKLKDYDLVLVDTAGRNFRDASYVHELKEMIDFEEDSDNFLVLGLTSKYSDMKEIFEQFHDIPIHQMIFTKADETASIGSAINMMITHGVGAAYLTNGQNVPDDIREASAMNMARSVMEGFVNEGSS
ncbi:flagellar biosynthesis protein FlhF [Halobacillus litoralis]|uniref:Flagellar biosynthesis protein FlhF n=1 Tax=Halobacillus litoralis TaxID=45668 RepID=A0A410M8F3_9BACI|nr:flagellar biosynthesis protein FlhF [Halobacillus litoralis]QAS50981.1 flagellar biosynthesis protein FlhF [Halobacillus litoralis]